MFIAARDPAGAAVEPAQPGEPVSGQDPVHRGGMQSEQVGDAGRSPATQYPDLMMRRSVRVGVRFGL